MYTSIPACLLNSNRLPQKRYDQERLSKTWRGQVESLLRGESAKRKALDATLREALEVETTQRLEQMAMERAQREQQQMKQVEGVGFWRFWGLVVEVGDFLGLHFFWWEKQLQMFDRKWDWLQWKKTSASLQEELQKVLLERHEERLAERCVEQLAQLKEQLAEEQGVDALGEAERMSPYLESTHIWLEFPGKIWGSKVSLDGNQETRNDITLPPSPNNAFATPHV